MFNKVVTSDCNGVRTITLQRPEKKNALDAEMFEGLTKQLRRAAVGEEVKVPWLKFFDRFSLLTFPFHVKRNIEFFFHPRLLSSLELESIFQVATTWATFLLQSLQVL